MPRELRGENCDGCADGYYELHRKAPPCDQCEPNPEPPQDPPMDMLPSRLDVKAIPSAPAHFREYYLSQENPDATNGEIDREWAITLQDLKWYDVELAKDAEKALLEAGHKNAFGEE